VHKEGTQALGRASQGIETAKLRYSAAASLADLARDYALFTHAAFFTWGAMDLDPLQDLIARHPAQDCLAFDLVFKAKLFTGLVRRSDPQSLRPYAHKLLCMPRELWADIGPALGAVTAVDRTKQRFFRAAPQEIVLLDVLALSKAATLPAIMPTVMISVFGVDATDVNVRFFENVSGPTATAQVRMGPLSDETRRLASAVLQHAPRPFQSIARDPWQT